MECSRCHGSGTLLICWDDLCHGLGECMHGDGEIGCPDCGGEGCDGEPDDDAREGR